MELLSTDDACDSESKQQPFDTFDTTLLLDGINAANRCDIHDNGKRKNMVPFLKSNYKYKRRVGPQLRAGCGTPPQVNYSVTKTPEQVEVERLQHLTPPLSDSYFEVVAVGFIVSAVVVFRDILLNFLRRIARESWVWCINSNKIHRRRLSEMSGEVKRFASGGGRWRYGAAAVFGWNKSLGLEYVSASLKLIYLTLFIALWMTVHEVEDLEPTALLKTNNDSNLFCFQIKSEEVVQAYIERCQQVNPLINAIVQDRFEEALEEAREVDRVIAKGINSVESMEELTPLLGVPVTVKESIAVKGLTNQAGRVFKTPQIAKSDAPVVEQIKKFGGIIMLVSNTPELCLLWETYNNVTGQTKNPYDLKRTPGGSSGGEAALLASGASLLGLTSDIGGSSRLPAMFSGIWGHKPTPYAVSFKGHHPTSDFPKWGDFFTIAPMTRYAKDLPLLLKCMADPTGPKLTLDKEINVSSIRFFFMDNDGPSGMMRPLSRDLHAAINRVANDFNAKRVNIRKMKWSLDISLSAMLTMKNIETIYHKTEEGERPKTVCTETVKYFFGCSDSILPSVIFGHLQNFMKIIPNSRHKHLATIIEALKTEFKELLGTDGVFLYPTFPNTAHQHYQIYHKLLEPMYMAIFNTLGLPVTNCMIGLDRRNLPMGIQVVANPGQDHLCLAVAREMERRYGGWVRPPTEESSNKLA